MAENNSENIAKLSFEQALKQLEEIVRNLESGGQALEESIKNYEKGVALKEHCEQKLKHAKLKVEEIITAADGKISTKDIEAE